MQLCEIVDIAAEQWYGVSRSRRRRLRQLFEEEIECSRCVAATGGVANAHQRYQTLHAVLASMIDESRFLAEAQVLIARLALAEGHESAIRMHDFIAFEI